MGVRVIGWNAHSIIPTLSHFHQLDVEILQPHHEIKPYDSFLKGTIATYGFGAWDIKNTSC